MTRIQKAFRLRRVMLPALALGGLAVGITRLPGREQAASNLSTLAHSAAPPAQAAGSTENVFDFPVYQRWESFTVRDGLPSNRAFCVRADGERVWVGTDNGLALYRNGGWTVLRVEDGLPHRAVLSLDVSGQTGDLWVATMGGLARYSAGRFDSFTQLNSGLSNDFVNDVECDPDAPYIWAATAMGLSRLDLRTGAWTVFTEQNTPMREPWTYSVAVEGGLVWVGAWGAGVLEHHKASGLWREYRDPDKEMEIDLLPDDGPVHDVTAGVAFRSGILWQATYLGLARYDGRQWRSYFKEDSGLASNFINFVRARNSIAWLCTDAGLSASDGERWVTYRRRQDGRGEVFFQEGKERLSRRLDSIFVHNFVHGIDFQGDEIWVATDGGISRGLPGRPRLPRRARPSKTDPTMNSTKQEYAND